MRRISFPCFDQPLAQLFFIHKAEAQHIAAFVDSGDALINRAHAIFCFVAVFGLGGDGAGAAAAAEGDAEGGVFRFHYVAKLHVGRNARDDHSTCARFFRLRRLFGLYPDGRQ